MHRQGLTIIHGGGDTESNLARYVSRFGSVLEPYITASNEQFRADPSQTAQARLYRYGTTLSALSTVFLSIAATERFKQPVLNEFSGRVFRIASKGIFIPAERFEVDYLAQLNTTNPVTHHRARRNKNIVHGMKASLFLWDVLTGEPTLGVSRPPAKLDELIAATVDQHAQEYTLAPESKVVSAAGRVTVQPDIKEAIEDFTSIVGAESTSPHWFVNNYTNDALGHRDGLAIADQVVDPYSFRAGALIVASLIDRSRHLRLVTQ